MLDLWTWIMFISEVQTSVCTQQRRTRLLLAGWTNLRYVLFRQSGYTCAACSSRPLLGRTHCWTCLECREDGWETKWMGQVRRGGGGVKRIQKCAGLLFQQGSFSIVATPTLHLSRLHLDRQKLCFSPESCLSLAHQHVCVHLPGR